jgi:tetratricopeptide (TPR) repeat protein
VNARDRAAKAFGAWRERLDRGERVDPEDVIGANPELAAELRAQFAAMRRAERALDGGAAAAAAGRLVGRTLGPWRLGAVLGSGGMGTVFVAKDGDERAAVKVLHPHLLARPGFVERFLREAEIGRRVRHPNVVATLDAGAASIDGQDVHYLVMERVEGRTLRALLDDLGRVPEALCRDVGRETARALAAIHAAGAVHRDLKPDNVIVVGGNSVKVMDLGVARLRDEAARLSQTGAFVGSVQYGAPEQFSDPESVDARADLHALGLVRYELATGVHPFHADGFHAVVRRVLDETPRPAAELNPQLSPFFEELLAQLLEKDRTLRPDSAQDVARLLEEGEESAWWRERASAIRGRTKRPLRRIRVPRETALYGRDVEMTRLRALFDVAKSGEGQVVLVEGEAGVGKSRLVDEFVGRLAESGEAVNFLYGSYPPGGAATASGAFSTAYREHLGDSEAAVRAALPQTPLLAPAFAALLRGDVAPSGAEPLTKASLQTAFVHATRSFAATRPTIVLIDDLHFAPEEGRALFAALALAVPGHRILLVGASRPGLDGKWLGQIERLGHATRLALTRLSPKDLVRLLADSLKSVRLAEELAGKIATKSDGNPFFVFEILRGLREGPARPTPGGSRTTPAHEFLTQRPDGTWATTKLIAEIDVPSSVVDLVQARVSDLGRGDRDALEVASCVGFEFDPTLIADVLGIARIPLLQTLGAVEKSHRLVRSVGRRFVFDHHQVMEVLYAGISAPLREEYHAAIGAVIEERSGAASKRAKDLDGGMCVGLADHFLAGAKGERALPYLDAALTFLQRRYLSDAAVRLADRALSSPGLLAGKRRCEVLLLKADRLNLLARRKEQAECLHEADALAERDPALLARTRLASGQFFKVTNRPDDACAALADAISLGRQVGDRRVEADASVWLGNVLRGLGRNDEARPHLESGLATSREAGESRIEANATASLGVLYASLGRWDEARSQFERHRAMSLELNDRRGEALASGNLGNVFDAFGRYDEARVCHERHAALCREFGDRVGEALATGNVGNILTVLGRLDEARSNLEQQFAISREIGDRRGEALALVNLGPIWLQLGDVARAREALSASAALCRETGARWPEGYALHGLAEVADADGDAALALRLHEEALALRRSNGFDGVVADSLLEIGALRRRAGDADGARAALDEAVALVRNQRRPQELALGLALLACLPGGNAATAIAALATAGSGIDSPRVRFLLWEATRDRVHLVEAKRLLDHLVAHAPPAHRESMLANVSLHREIAEAARANAV